MLRSMRRLSLLSVCSLAAGLAIATPAAAQNAFLTLSSLTTGPAGTFTGSFPVLSTNITGSIVSNAPGFFEFKPTGTGYGDSVTTHDSPQYSNSGIFSPSQPFADQIGYEMHSGEVGTAQISISFSKPVTNPVFHVANIDSAQWDFSPTIGLNGLTLLSGNGGGGDGILVTGSIVSDADATTLVGVSPSDAPPTSGARSAYGSVQLTGTFSTITFDVERNPQAAGYLGGDSGNFTISTSVADAAETPEPGTVALLVTGGLSGAAFLRCKRRK